MACDKGIPFNKVIGAVSLNLLFEIVEVPV